MPSILNATTTSGLVTSADNSGSLQLQTNNGTTAVTIDTSQNVGIGTTSPSGKLHSAQSTNSQNLYIAGGLNYIAPSSSSPNQGVYFGFSNLANGSNGILFDMPSGWTGNIFSANLNNVQQFAVSQSGTLSFNSGYGSVAVAFGCRAWVNFNGTGTVAIRASGNVSSITDNGTGDYTVNFTNAMPDANYALAGYSRNTGSSLTTSCISGTSGSSVSTSACRFLNLELNTSGSHNYGYDSDFINVAFFR